MSTLSNKILSYSPEVYYGFNQAYTTTPTNLGSSGSTTFVSSNEAPIYQSTGGIHGEGAWRFNAGNGTGDLTTSRLAVSGASNLNNTYSDVDYSIGFWFKTNYTLQNSLAHAATYNIFIGGGAPQRTFTMSIVGGVANSTDKGKVQITATGSSGVKSTTRIDDQQWHYFAVTAQPYVPANGLELKFYVDGLYLGNAIPTVASNSLNTTFGPAGSYTTSAGANDLTTHDYSDFYVAPRSIIDATQILEIYNSATTTVTNINYTNTSGATATALIVDSAIFVNSNAIILETPATSDAVFAEPTIIVVTPNYTQITTSIVASVVFPDATVQTSKFVNNIVDPTLATAELINNVDIQTGTDVSFSAQEMTASAEITMPFLPSALTASALMVDPQIVIPQSYFNFVKQNNPYVYWNQFPVGNTVVYPNFGSLNMGTIDKGPTGLNGGLLTQVASGIPLSSVGDGFSLGLYATSYSLNDNRFRYTPPTATYQTLSNMYLTKNWTHEFWYKPTNNSTNVNFNSSYQYGDNYLRLKLTHTPNSNTMTIDLLPLNNLQPWGTDINTTITNQSTLLTHDTWHHVALVASSWSSTQIRFDLYIDSVFIGVSIQTFNHSYQEIYDQISQTPITWFVGLNSSIDELAIYPSSLSSSTLSTKYNFVDSISPNKNIGALPFETSALMLDSNVIIVSNINNQEIPATASSLFVNPEISPGKTINFTADAMLASATNTDVIVYWGWTVVATPMISAAESKEGFVLNDIYYNYVQANIAPYRYVTFDAADTSLDYGTDNDYSVVPTVVGGTIVNPDLGINGKSAKTAGISYITDGVILKESEWNDSWGTGVNSYHSAFWFQRALDDTSTTGLRVLWNLNGYKDNQHVVLYQYQNKLHLQFNNGSGTWIEQDTGTLDLFDYNRHFVVVNFNHTNPVNNIVTVYVDSVLKMTIDLGAYTGTTTNASSADSGANDELNNHPRLGIGCLITPFAATALPVVPTNTKLIIDEIYWDKNATNQTQVTNLFNTMPGKFNVNKLSDPMLASDEFVMPAFATTVNFITAPFTASGELLEPELYIEREVIYLADFATATGLMANAEVNENRTLFSDPMQAIATFNDPGVQITIPGGPMLASAFFPKNVLYNSLPLTEFTAYLRYARTLNFITKQFPMKEVK